MKIAKLALLAAAALTLPVQSEAITYNGELKRSDGGLLAGGDWSTDDITLSWEVTNEGVAAGWWRYTYTWSGQAPDLSHLIIEVSGNAAAANFQFPGGTELRTDMTSTKGYGPSFPGNNANPGLTSDFTGVKWESGRNTVFTFLSDRVPVWGDFYANGGSSSYVVNAGFAAADPLNPPSNGSINNHILRPDSVTVSTPDGGATAALLGLGIAGLAVARGSRK